MLLKFFALATEAELGRPNRLEFPTDGELHPRFEHESLGESLGVQLAHADYVEVDDGSFAQPYPEEVLALIASYDGSDELLQAMRKWLGSVDTNGRQLWLMTSE